MERILIAYPHTEWLKAALTVLNEREIVTFESYSKALEHVTKGPVYGTVCCGLSDKLSPQIFEKALERNARTRLIGIVRNLDQVNQFAQEWRKGHKDQELEMLADPLVVAEVLKIFPPQSTVIEGFLDERCASNDWPVLIEGEPGTGKKRLAAQIHRLSSRSKAEFRIVQCDERPVEGRLFARCKSPGCGAGPPEDSTVEQAEGGTVILAGVEQLQSASQLLLLELLEQQLTPAGSRIGRMDVRIIATANRSLRTVLDDLIRSDLFYALSANYIRLQPMRERPEDLERLAVEFVKRFRQETRDPDLIAGAAGAGLEDLFSPHAVSILRSYPWPDNIPELKFALQYAFLRTRDQIDASHLPPWIVNRAARIGHCR